MCGITGIFDVYGKYPIRRETLAAMANALKHRGPDEKAYFIAGNVGLGFRRLSIIDVQNGHQPFFSDDGAVRLICNGEIYNHRELRGELQRKGYAFKTNCDVEVVLYLYLEYGTGFLHKLNGQFAFAISDSAKGLFFMARDPFGVCPLFYTLPQDVLIFGSEIKAILQHPLVRREVNLTGLDQTFSFPGLVSPATMFKGVY
ncbi:MAG: asparagine synthetase B, partial [Cytophagales bacterium]|nr:asparagine synthetase B [Cytophagales bacterium]